MTSRFTASLFVLFFLSGIAGAADTPSATIEAGTYVAQNSYFVSNSLSVTNWAEDQIVSSGINYGNYTSSFKILVKHMQGQKDNVFYGKGTLVSGQCSWPMEIKIYSYAKKLYVEDTAPQTINTDCTSSAGSWTPTVEPFVMQ